MKASLYILIVISLIAFCSCNLSEPSALNKNISLLADDVTATEVWIKIDKGELNGNTELILNLNDDQLKFSLYSKDTLIYKDGLKPSTQYTVAAQRIENGKAIEESSPVSFRTMDTTSHNFTFTKYNVGNSFTFLHSVKIINDNDIWVVGEINKDSNGDSAYADPYGFAHWDGNTWTIIKVPYNVIGLSGQFSLIPSEIIAFASNDIWLTGGSVHHYDESKITSYWINSFTGNPYSIWDKYTYATDLWGTSSNDLYAVGSKGSIAHFDGITWKKIESGTDLDIQDIWGVRDEKTGEVAVLCVASNTFNTGGLKLLSIKNGKVEEYSNEGIHPITTYSSLYMPNKNKIYISGDGIYWKNLGISSASWISPERSLTEYYTHKIRGNNASDIVISGAAGELLHFNGKSWRSYLNNGIDYFEGNLYSVDIKGNTLCAVGNQGVIYIGRR